MKISEGQLVGKVVGFQNFELTFELTEQEQQVFDAFKADYNIEKLKNMTPQAITKMFLLSDIEKIMKHMKHCLQQIRTKKQKVFEDIMRKRKSYVRSCLQRK